MKSYISKIRNRRLNSSIHNTSRSKSKQSGQVLLVVLFFSAILGVGLLTIYNTAQLTADKRELVNVADAAAHSGASILAQGLNYTAYTNRAILANNALIGQMVSIRSTLAMSHWYWKNTKEHWAVIKGITRPIPYLGQAVGAISGAAEKFAEGFGMMLHYAREMAKTLQILASVSVGVTNHALWVSQQIHMGDSIVSYEKQMIDLANSNLKAAEVDPVLIGSATRITAGLLLYYFKTKRINNKRTVGNRGVSERDEYLNYVTETNRGVAAPSYVGGRKLLPNAVGLFIATGCGNPVLSGIPVMTTSPTVNEEQKRVYLALETLSAAFAPIANALMCFYKRHGGTELVQNNDGTFSWVAIDAMALAVPSTNIVVPFAGGAVASFVPGKEETNTDSIKQFIGIIKNRGGEMAHGASNAKEKYFGHQVALRPDCVESVNPINFHLKVIDGGRFTSGCFVLATGIGKDYMNKGLFGKELAKTADKILKYGSAPTEDEPSGTGDIFSQLSMSADDSASESNSVNPPENGEPDGLTEYAKTTRSLKKPSNNGNDLSIFSRLMGNKPDESAVVNESAPRNSDGGFGGNRRAQLRATFGMIMDVESVINLNKRQISDGIEIPRKVNKVLHALRDGLPLFFWDVRIHEKWQEGKAFGEAQDLVYTDEDPQHDHEKRLNLGPLVYFPLIKPVKKTKTAENSDIGAGQMGLPDYNGGIDGMRAIGKARIYFRDPADHWMTRYGTIKTKSLILPYWQVRNESLSYLEKLSLFGGHAIHQANVEAK